jgi:hypothetical protein
MGHGFSSQPRLSARLRSRDAMFGTRPEQVSSMIEKPFSHCSLQSHGSAAQQISGATRAGSGARGAESSPQPQGCPSSCAVRGPIPFALDRRRHAAGDRVAGPRACACGSPSAPSAMIAEQASVEVSSTRTNSMPGAVFCAKQPRFSGGVALGAENGTMTANGPLSCP